MSTDASEYQTTRIWKKTLKTLKLIAAHSESSIVETMDRLANREWAQLQGKTLETKQAMNYAVSLTYLGNKVETIKCDASGQEPSDALIAAMQANGLPKCLSATVVSGDDGWEYVKPEVLGLDHIGFAAKSWYSTKPGATVYTGKMTAEYLDPIEKLFAVADPYGASIALKNLMKDNVHSHGILPVDLSKALSEWKQQCVSFLGKIPALPYETRTDYVKYPEHRGESLKSVCFVKVVHVQSSKVGESLDGMRNEYDESYSYNFYICDSDTLNDESKLRAWCLDFWQKRVEMFDRALAMVAVSPMHA